MAKLLERIDDMGLGGEVVSLEFFAEILIRRRRSGAAEENQDFVAFPGADHG
jgi:hypothetical protein